MTSNAKRSDEAISHRTRNSKAVKAVENGYRHLIADLESYRIREGKPKGTVLNEVLHKLPRGPVLLDDKQYADFREIEGIGDAGDGLMIIWNILENVCNEWLMPAITIDRKSGHFIVVLTK